MIITNLQINVFSSSVFWRQRRVVLWCTHTGRFVQLHYLRKRQWLGAAIIARGAPQGLIFQLPKFLYHHISSPPAWYSSCILNSIHNQVNKFWCLVHAYTPRAASNHVILIFRCASISSTYPCQSVRRSVRPSVTLSDFQSVSVSGRPTWKVEERGPQLFFNFGSG